MNIDHVHFYVTDACALRQWLVDTLSFQWLGAKTSVHTHTEVIGAGEICLLLSSALTDQSPVATYLAQHPPGVIDVAFEVVGLENAIAQATQGGATLLIPMRIQKNLKWAQIAGWADLKHTLIERTGHPRWLPLWGHHRDETPLVPRPGGLPSTAPEQSGGSLLERIDHIVLNVAAGDLQAVTAWYCRVLGFHPQQVFSIQTERSALDSQVLMHPNGSARFPMNEPASASSQIQEFLDVNRGAGIQHIALQTRDIVSAIAQFRRHGMRFLPVPSTYYEQVQQRAGFPLCDPEWQAIAAQQVLVDWQDATPEGVLLQTFTQPIFAEPTFFFEFIERRTYAIGACYQQAEGFGEGNFRALFEAIEREQMKRGSLR